MYREFVYKSGVIPREGKANLSPELVAKVVAYHGALGISDRLRYRIKNFSEGLAFGSYEFIASLQSSWRRKYVRPRPFLGCANDGNDGKECTRLFSTRVLRL